MQVVWLDPPSILRRRQRDFPITGSQSEAEEAWLESTGTMQLTGTV